jgi:alpha-L-fucosidase
MKKRIIGSCILFIFAFNAAIAQPSHPDSTRMAWFDDAKFGIFIHWGIYSVKGIDESWSFFNGYTSHDTYLEQLKGFTASRYNPEAWANLIVESGARYAVLTSKHHDGIALWPVPDKGLNVVDNTPAGRDLVKPFVEAVRKKGLKVGLYYSLPDWSHPDYPLQARDSYRYKDDSLRFKRFLSIQQGQLSDLMNHYSPDLIWFDGDWEHSAKEWNASGIRNILLDKAPNVIINSRLQGYGDYATPEQGLPVEKPKERYWELCLTMNNSWGYQPTDNNYKSADQLIAILADCIGMGGNLLLDIGPKEDGTIVQEQAHILKEMGRWVKKHQKAIFGSRSGLPAGRFNGPTTFSSDNKTLFLFVPNHAYGWLPLKGLNRKIAHVKLVGDGTNLQWVESGRAWWSETPGIYYIYLPEALRDSSMSVIAVHLK